MAERSGFEAAPRPNAYLVDGDVHAGVFGTGENVNIGAVGSNARGIVVDNSGKSGVLMLERCLELLEQTRGAMRDHRELVGERFDGLSDRLDEIEEDLKGRRSAGRVRRKLDDLATALKLIPPVAAPVAQLIQHFDANRL